MIDANERLRYLLVGIWNAVFGYFVGVLSLYVLSSTLYIAGAIVVANIVSISMSFLTYKTIVFRTKGNWFKEYLKAYMVYGLIAILNILLVIIFIDIAKMNIWLGQFTALLITVFISYFSHKTYTFKRD